MPYLFYVGLFCLINKDSDTFQGCSQNLKGQGSKPEKKGTIYTKLHINFYFYFYIFNILQKFALLLSATVNLGIVQTS